MHVTVLLSEAVELVGAAPNTLIVDCTLGYGGHSEALLQAGATVIGLDQDPNALAAASERLAPFGDRFTAVQARFGDLERVLEDLGIDHVDGVLADIGVSSPQLDQAERGFSFRFDGPLDMRMSQSGETAAELIDRVDLDELTQILRELGEERHARRIARAIVDARPLTTTAELAQLVAKNMPGRPGRIHPATRTFQGLRIAVNDELGQLDALLAAVPRVLKPGGRAAIISFHSLEDRRVKVAFRALAGVGAPKDPYGHPVSAPWGRLLSRKAITASDDNPRARSARLRGVQRASAPNR
jgi:16S rRNA (cytosine1402-N4)-methyltransferase